MSNSHFFLFHGTDSYLSLENLKTWVQIFKNKYPDSFLKSIDADEVSYPDFLQEIELVSSSGSLFDDIKLIIVKRINAYLNNKSFDLKLLFRLLSTVSEKNFIVFWADSEISQKSVIINFFNQSQSTKIKIFSKPISATEFNRWLERAVRQKNINLSPNEIDLLARHFGRDLIRKSKGEIVFPFDLGEITIYLQALSASLAIETDPKKIINNLVTPKVNLMIFDLTDSIIEQDIKVSLDKLHFLTQLHDPAEISAIIYWQFRIILKIIAAKKLGNTDNELIKNSKLSYFLFNKAKTIAEKIGPSKIENIYEILLDHDFKQKSGYDLYWLLDLLIIKLSQV